MLRSLLRLSLRVHGEQPMRRWKFVVRSVLYGASHRSWLDYLGRQAWLHRMVLLRPELVERLHRPYQCASFNRWARLGALQAHYDVCAAIGWQALCLRMAREALVLARLDAARQPELRLELGYDARFGKEGEWVLNLRSGSRRCYTMVLGFRKADSTHSLYIGCLQGPDGPESREHVRELTRALHGERPRGLLLEAARELAAAAGCSHLELVGDRQHIYRNLRKRRRLAFSYDHFAVELRAQPDGAQGWRLPLRAPERDLEDVASRKRAQTRRRRELLDAMRAQLRTQLRAACAVAPRPR